MDRNTLGRWRALTALMLLGGLSTYFVHLAFWQSQPIVDEGVHVPQVASFLAGIWTIQPNLAMIPGYHYLVATLLGPTGAASLGAMRCVSAVFGAVAASIFYLIRRKLNDEEAFSSAVFFYLCPLFFPYYFLVYTDVLSLAMVLFAVLSALSGRHVVAAGVMTLSLAVRQNNIIWAAFLAAYAAWPALTNRTGEQWARIRNACIAAAPYAMPLIVFVAYWRWNGSIVFDTSLTGAHPDMKLRAGNVWFTLFLYLLLFPHEAWKGLQSFIGAVRARPLLLLIPIVAAGFVRMRGSGDNHAFLDYFLRNAFIAYVAHGWARACFCVAVALAACSIAFTRFREPAAWMIYPFSALCLASSVLIENRYSMVPFALWMAFRSKNSPRYMIVVWLLVSSFLTYGVLTRQFML